MSEEQAEHTTDTSPDVKPDEGGTGGETGASTEETVSVDRYKNAERKITEQGQENSQLRERLAKLEGRFESQNATPPPPPPTPEPKWSDDEALLERFKDDPSSIAPYLDELREGYQTQRQRDLQATQAYVDEKMATVSPEAQAVKEQLDVLRKNPDYKGWHTADLMRAVNAHKLFETGTSSETPDESKPGFKGTSTGRRVDTGAPTESERDKTIKAIEARIRANIGANTTKPEFVI